MAFLAVSSSSILTPAQAYSAEEWEEKRSIITQLYREEAKKLHDVRVILASQHDFRPTAAMIKKRITKWSLDRKHKQQDMLVALRLASQREAQGKDTAFTIRENVVTLEEVKHYFRRKGIRDMHSLIGTAATAIATAPIDCHTPDSDTPPGDEENHGLGSIAGVGGLPVHHISTATEMCMSSPLVQFTATGSQLEQLLYFGRTHYDSVFEKPSWRTMTKAFDLRSLEAFYHEMFEGQWSLEKSSETCAREAFQHFSRAFDLVYSLLYQQTLLFLPYLYHMMRQFRNVRGQEVVSKLLAFIANMGEIHPDQYQVRQSVALLHQLPAEERTEFSGRVFQSILDRMNAEFRPDFDDDVYFRSKASKVCLCDFACQTRTEGILSETMNDFRYTSIAVWNLVAEAEILKNYRGVTAVQFVGSHADMSSKSLTLNCRAEKKLRKRFERSIFTDTIHANTFGHSKFISTDKIRAPLPSDEAPWSELEADMPLHFAPHYAWL